MDINVAIGFSAMRVEIGDICFLLKQKCFFQWATHLLGRGFIGAP